MSRVDWVLSSKEGKKKKLSEVRSVYQYMVRSKQWIKRVRSEPWKLKIKVINKKISFGSYLFIYLFMLNSTDITCLIEFHWVNLSLCEEAAVTVEFAIDCLITVVCSFRAEISSSIRMLLLSSWLLCPGYTLIICKLLAILTIIFRVKYCSFDF